MAFWQLRNLLVLAFLVSFVGAQEKIQFTAEDGQPLSGALSLPVGQPKGGVLLLHGHGANRSTYLELAKRLSNRGFHVLALDLRGHGESSHDAEGNPIDIRRELTSESKTNPFLLMHEDVRAGMTEVVRRGASKSQLAIVGAGVGGSIALHALAEHEHLAQALVLIGPAREHLGLPSIDHSKRISGLPVLLVVGKDEVDLGVKEIQEALKGAQPTLKVLDQAGVHGTRVFGRVPAIEADLIEWIEKQLAESLSFNFPFTKDIIVDGRLEESEALSSEWIDIPLSSERTARVRIARNRAKLLFGFDIPDRYLRQNEVKIFVGGKSSKGAAVDSDCFCVTFNPANPARKPIITLRGEGGIWKEVGTDGVQAHAVTEEKTKWTAEVALPLVRFFGDNAAREFRFALLIQGQKTEDERCFPPTAAVKTAPASWVAATLTGESDK